MAKTTSQESQGISPEIKQALLIALVIVGLLMAAYSGFRNLATPTPEVVGTIQMQGKSEAMEKQEAGTPVPE